MSLSLDVGWHTVNRLTCREGRKCAMASEHASHSVVGAYADMPHARKAIDALEFAGVDAGHISLLGEGMAEAVREANASKNTTRRDAPMLQRIILRAIVWGIAGAVVGSGLGLVLAAIGMNFASSADNFALQAAAWALFGTILGTLWGAYSGISQGEAWEMTFAADSVATDGRILVSVQSGDASDIERAEKILREKEAMTVRQFDSQGQPMAGAP